MIRHLLQSWVFAIALWLLPVGLFGQQVVHLEYFFDSIPATSQGTIITLTPNDTVDGSFGINTSGLDLGRHLLLIRAVDSNGLGGHYWKYWFFVDGGQTTPSIDTWEWFTGSDPGLGAANVSTVTPADTVNITGLLTTDTLSAGRYRIFTRVRNDSGQWSHFYTTTLFVDPQHTNVPLTGLEYFIDQDPGAGNASPIAISAADTIDQDVVVQTDTLALGSYVVSMRAKNAANTWSHTLSKPFDICTVFGPKARFEPVVNRNQVTFLNNSEYTDSVRWDFGDGQQNTVAYSPKHEYVPGVYTACLEGINICGLDTVCTEVIVPGISHVSPSIHGNDGIALIDIYGAAFDVVSTVRLIKDGAPEIEATVANYIDHTHLRPVFKFRNNPIGTYDLIVDGPQGKSDTLRNGVTLEPSTGYDLWIDMAGPYRMLINSKVSMTVLVGNKGNNTAYGVPLFIKAPVSSSLSVKGNLHQDSLPQGIYDSIPHFSVFEDPFNEDTTVFGGFVIPMVRPGEVQRFTFTYQPTALGEAEIIYYLSDPLVYEWQLDSIFRSSCSVANPCIQCGLDLLGLVPAAGCAVGLFDLACAIIENTTGKGSGGAMDLMGSVAGAILNCTPAGSISKAYKLAKEIGGGFGGGAGALSSCLPIGSNGCSDDPKKPKPINPVTSMDPNIKVGPTGFTSENYIQGTQPLIYTIYFENADTATSPANEVVVVDTLDGSMLDLTTVRFLSFGFGDTSMSVLENRDPAYFVRDIDLRPARQTIVRIIGQLDTATGVLTTSYTSLDPDTMKSVYDPFDGFLPPNVNAPEGEGYIQFMINLRPGHQHLDEIENKAAIYFDANDPIETPEWTNTIDLQPPSSAVDVLPDSILDTVFTVSWGGTDAHAGVMDYDVYVIEDDTLEYPWKVGIGKTSAQFKGDFGKRYKFYSVARDNAGNEELPPADPVLNPDAQTILLNPTAVRDLMDPKQWLTVHPNPAGNTAWITWEQSQPASIQLSLIDASGTTVYSTEGHYPSGVHRSEMALADLPSGIYIVRLRVDGRPIYSKLVIYH